MRSIYLNDLLQDERLATASGILGRCAACGYAIRHDEEAVTVSDTGDLIHRACWEDYAADNAEEFFVSEEY